MIDIITSYVFNGSITGDNYIKWLPFYDYGYYVLGLLILSFAFNVIRNRFLSNVFSYLYIASLLSLPILYVLYRYFIPTPNTIYIWWIFIQFLIHVILAFIFSMTTFSEFETKKDYMKHIKKEHLDIWEKYHKDDEKE